MAGGENDKKVMEDSSFVFSVESFVHSERFTTGDVQEIDLALDNVEQDLKTVSAMPTDPRLEHLLNSSIPLERTREMIEFRPRKKRNAVRLQNHLWDKLVFSLRDAATGKERQFWSGGTSISLCFFKNHLDW